MFHDLPANVANPVSDQRREAILSAAAFAGQQFLRSDAWDATVNKVLARLGQASAVDRVYIFESHTNRTGKAVASLRYEWTRSPNRRLLDTPGLQNIPYFRDSTVRWREQLRKGQILTGDIDADPPAVRKVLRLLLVHSFAAVPIFVAGEWWGTIGFADSHSSRNWSDGELDALSIAASLLGAAFERHNIHRERAESERFWALMARLSAAALEAVDESKLLAATVQPLAEVIRADHCLVLLWDAVQERALAAAATPEMRQILTEFGQPVRAGPMMARLLAERRTLVIDDVRELDPRYASFVARLPVSCGLIAPMIGRGQVLGAVVLSFAEWHAISNLEIGRAELATQQLAHFLHNTRLLAAETRARQQADKLRTVGHAISSSLDLIEVLERILSELQQVVPYDSASVQRMEGNQSVIVAAHGFSDARQAIGVAFDLDDPSLPNQAVYQSGRSAILGDVVKSYGGFDKAGLPGGVIRSWMGVPMIFGDRAIGMLTLDRIEEDYYTAQHAELAEAFAVQAAIALENARLFEVTRQLNVQVWQQAKQLRQVIDAVPAGIVLLDTQNNIVLANSTFHTLLPWLTGVQKAVTLEQICGRPVAWFAQNDPAVGWREVEVVGAETRHFTVIAAPIAVGPDSGGLVLVIADVTADHERREQQRAQERLATIGALASGIAHDFNNILQGVIGFADLLSQHPDIPPSARTRLTLMAREGQRGADLIKLIVEHSREIVITPRPLDLEALVRRAARSWELAAQRPVEIHTAGEGAIPEVSGDALALQDALTNLVVDAAQSLEAGHPVVIRLSGVAGAPGSPFPPPTGRPPRRVEIEVTGGARWFASPEEVMALRHDLPLMHVAAGRTLMLAKIQVAVRQHRGAIVVHDRNGARAVTISLPASSAGEPLAPSDQTTDRKTAWP